MCVLVCVCLFVCVCFSVCVCVCVECVLVYIYMCVYHMCVCGGVGGIPSDIKCNISIETSYRFLPKGWVGLAGLDAVQFTYCIFSHSNTNKVGHQERYTIGYFCGDNLDNSTWWALSLVIRAAFMSLCPDNTGGSVDNSIKGCTKYFD